MASEYHLVLNPDFEFGSEVLQTLYQFMQDHADVGLVMPRVLYPDGSEQHLCKLLPTPFDLVARRFVGGAARFLFREELQI
jgi:GT2 family glycosyltransferase